MFFTQHIYLLSALISLVFWIFIFILNNKREDRRKMIIIGLFTMVLAVVGESMYLIDWWQPKFIYDFPVHLEDIIFGFASGGVISGLYTLLSKKRGQVAFQTFQNIYKIPLLVLFFFCLFGLFYIFNVSSFLSNIYALSVPLLFLIAWRIKVLPAVFLTASIVTLFALFTYLFIMQINPTYVGETYLFNYLSGDLFMGIPVEELLWFFFAGLGVSSFQELFFSS